jgi:hypothetical protein
MDPISNWAEPKSHLMNTRSENFYKVAGGGGVQNYTTLGNKTNDNCVSNELSVPKDPFTGGSTL